MEPPRKRAKVTESNGASNRESSHAEERRDSTDAPTSAKPQDNPKCDKFNWRGFCEILSDPAILNYMLRELGVKDVKTREIVCVDQLEDFTRPIYGIIVCSKYKKSDDQEEDRCPDNVWFANQISHNSCLSVAMLNILNNVVGLDLGVEVQEFKDKTQDQTPFLRGVALADFEFLRRVHNSFATEMDMLNADLMLKGEYEDAQRTKAKKANAKPKSKSKTNPKLGAKKQTARSASAKNKNYDQNASNHYQAFLAIDNELWKLDGMDRQPTNLGSIEDSGDWTTYFQPMLQDIIRKCGGALNIMCLCRDPVIDARAELAKNIATIAAVEQELTVRDPDWRAMLTDEDTLTGPLEEFGIDADAIGTAVVDAKIQDQISSYDFGDLFDLRNNVLARKQGPLRQNLEDLSEKEAKELLTAEEAMIDFGPFIRRWLLELGKASKLKELIKKVELINKAARAKR